MRRWCGSGNAVADDPPLNPKQATFVREYMVDLNATQAAVRAGYSKRTARLIGQENLGKPHIAAAIKAAMDARAHRVQCRGDDVLREIERLAMFDPVAFVDVKKPADLKKLSEDVRRAIVGWGWDRSGRFTIKLAKEGALEMLGRHHGLFKDPHLLPPPPAGPPVVVNAIMLSDAQLATIAAGGQPKAAGATQ